MTGAPARMAGSRYSANTDQRTRQHDDNRPQPAGTKGLGTLSAWDTPHTDMLTDVRQVRSGESASSRKENNRQYAPISLRV